MMSATPKIRTQSTFKSTLTIDDVLIDVRIKRMNNAEFDAFAEGFAKAAEPRGPEESPDARRARERESADWMREALNENLTIVAGQIEHDGREITRGGNLLDIYGGRLDVVPQALALVFGENRVSEKKKETYRSLLVSQFGSIEEPPTPAADGTGAVSTAARVDAKGSTEAGAATAGQNDASSGTTDPSA
jgi:hypothetical protein